MAMDALENTLGNPSRQILSREPYQTYAPYNPYLKNPGAGTTFGELSRLDPRQLSPVQMFPASNMVAGVENFFEQLRPTSSNVRNRGVMNILQSMNTPMEQLYASQLAEPLVQGRSSSLDQLRSQMTQRGMYNSGIADEARLGVETDYLKGMGQVAGQARSKEIERQAGLANQLLGVAENDIAYYRYLTAGRNAILGQTQPVDIAGLQGLSKGASGLAAASLFGNRQPETPYYGGSYEGQASNEGGFSTESGSGGQSTIGGTSSFGGTF